MNKEIQEKLRKMSHANPVDEAVMTILKSQSQCCVRARVRLEEMKKTVGKNVLFISGSPRKGNTEHVISRLYESVVGNKEILLLRSKNVKRCIGCLACHHQPVCTIKDDDVPEIMESVLAADVLVIGTPNYFENVSGLTKDFIDRLHPFYKPKTIQGKKLIIFMVGGGKSHGSLEMLKSSMQGFVKHYGLELVGAFAFQGLNPKDVECDPQNEQTVSDMVEMINGL
ncbi:flavodoxin family protein [Candidatus Falkowbacteria bacterium]|nr:flavodoxin family protein [Candidatus Falkowbacteria bacterium]